MSSPPTDPSSDISIFFMDGVFMRFVLQQILLCIILLLVYKYSRTVPRDSSFNTGVVVILMVMTVALCLLDYQILYQSAAQPSDRPFEVGYFGWSLSWEFGITTAIGGLAHFFFLGLCFSVTESRVIVMIGLALILSSLGFGFASALPSIDVDGQSQGEAVSFPMDTWLVSSASADVFLAGSLIWGFTHARSRTEVTNFVRIVRLFLQTNLASTIIATLACILYFVLPGKALYMLPLLTIGKVYVISVLVTLTPPDDSTTHSPRSLHTQRVDGTTGANELHRSGMRQNTRRVRDGSSAPPDPEATLVDRSI